MSAEKGVSRRAVIRQIAIGMTGSLALGASVYALGVNSERIYPRAPEPEDVTPYGVLDGVVAISKGANLRTSPKFPNTTRFSQPSNVIAWDDIATVNFADVASHPVAKEVFVVSNPEIVKGQPASYMDLAVNGKAELVPVRTDWIKLRVQTNKNRSATPVYVNLNGSEGFVRQLGVTKMRTVGDGSYIPFETRGRIYAPYSIETLEQDILPGAWAERVGRKLDGKAQLEKYFASDARIDPSEKIIKKGTVVAAGDSWNEKLEMERVRGMVNVRNYPSQEFSKGKEVPVMGKVEQGVEIEHFLAGQNGFIGVRRKDIHGEIKDGNGFPQNIHPNHIVAISESYILFTDSSRA